VQDGSAEVVPNLEKGFATVVGVYEDYHIVDGRLGPASHTRIRHYAPAVHPEIPGELAKLQRGDVEAVLKFARVYGELGYRAFIPHEVWARGGAIPVGDPLLWVWAHAHTLRICLELSYRLEEGDITSLRSYVRSLHVTQADLEVWESWLGGPADDRHWASPDTWPTAVVAKRGEITHYQWGWLGWGSHDPLHYDDVKALARRIRRSLINANIAGIRRVLLDDGRNDRLFWEFRALIEMAYWHVAQAVDGKHMKRCEAEDCGAHFVQTDSRQRFCPPMFGQKGESRCAVRHRVQKHREKASRQQR
jgi:hypothetical protein